jgi:ATP-dependent Clp protease ATP-binding subunit ClpX
MPNDPKCSFCGRGSREAKTLIAGPGADIKICDTCIEDAGKLLQGQESGSLNLDDLPTPEEIKVFLDQYVIGQDLPKEILSVAAYNHYKRMKMLSLADQGVEIEKSNIIMMGPTGCGKTLLVKTLARLLQVPFAQADATTLTESGYVGEDVENVVGRLLLASNGSVEDAQRGIIYIDEIDKISRKGENASLTRDVSGEGVQQALLKLIEGSVVSVPPLGERKHPQANMTQVDTSHILFIVSGAFDGLESIIHKRVTGKNNLGFGNKQKAKVDAKEVADIFLETEPEDLRKFGIIPEMLGRLPIIAPLQNLNEDEMVHILTEPKNALVKQFKAMFEMEGVELVFTKGALRAIASKALDLKTGGRGLRTIVERALRRTQFVIPSDKTAVKVTVTEENILEGTEPKITRKRAKKTA